MSQVMLSRINGPRQHLLKHIGVPRRKPEPGARRTETRRASPGINDAPLSSDNESEGDHENDNEPELPEEDTLLRPSQGKARSQPSAPPPVTSSSSPDRSRTKTIGKKNGQRTNSSISPKRPAEEEGVDSGPDPLAQDAFGLFSSQSSQGQRRTKRMKSYGGMGSASRNASMTVQQIRRRDNGNKKRFSLGKTKGMKGFKMPLMEEDFEDNLRKVGEKSGSPLRNKFKNPTEIYSVKSPVRENQIGGFRVPVFLPEDDIDPLAISEPPRRSSRLVFSKAKDAKRSNTALEAGPTSSAIGHSVSSTTTPLEIDGVSSDTSTSPLSSPPDSPLHESSSTDIDGTVCPLCNQRLDDELKKRVMSESGRLNFRRQEEICKQHRIRSGREEWKKRGYPEIDWKRLSTNRIPSFYPKLEDILQGRTRSVYRERLEARIKTGKNRTLKQRMMIKGGGKEEAEEEALLMMMMTTGYYGPRGGQLFEEMILSRFSGLIRQLAGRDPIMASRGVSEYVQGVLVPELATSLIMEDMSVDSEEARRIMRESAEMGELINDEQG